MKRLLLLALALVAFCSVQAQRPVYVYGVDFAQCKVFGALETPSEFQNAFIGVNELLYGQMHKYNFASLVGNNAQYYLQPMIDRNKETQFATIKLPARELPILDVQQIIKTYELPQIEGQGFVMIARLLDKTQEKGFYYLVTFDVATRELLKVEEAEALAGGFGLRNYWARTVYNILIDAADKAKKATRRNRK